MSKGIIILDEIPKTCIECPIRPLPDKAHHEDYCDNGRYDKGWNECLEKNRGRWVNEAHTEAESLCR